MGQRHGPPRVVSLIHTVGRWGFVLSADRLVRAAGDGVWQGRGRGERVGGVVPGRQLGARGFRNAAATERGDAAAVAARQDGGVGDQAGRLALGGRGGERWHCGLWRDKERQEVRFLLQVRTV